MVDGDNTNKYNIKKVYTRNVYNHTPWDHCYIHDQTATNPGFGSINDNTSITKIFQNFLDYIDTNGTGAGYKSSQEWSNLKEAIENFGNKNNRRRVYIIQLDKDPRTSPNFPDTSSTATQSKKLRFVDDYIELEENNLPTSPAIFETEAKEDVDLNIYYEASSAIPLNLNKNNATKGDLLGPVGSKVTCPIDNTDLTTQNNIYPGVDFHPRVVYWNGDVVTINGPGLRDWNTAGDIASQNGVFKDQTIRFWRNDVDYVSAEIESVEEVNGNYVTKLKIKPDTQEKRVGLSWYNCFSFGNGVESNRIRDDFNESFILNGVKASTVLEEPYEEERRKHGLIYSGLYNSTSGVNNLNQFIQAEKITKDLMPSYGSIQKLYARDKDLITLCEDKVLQIFVDKDILYNADGNAQLLSTNQVLGEANPFRGNFGISKNPESFASESFRAYFTDKQRGAVLRLSMDGLTPISDAGMHDYFRDNLRDGIYLIGTYDSHKKNYNLTINYGTLRDLVCNPEFQTGTFNQYQEVGGELALNPDFNVSTTWSSNIIFNPSFNSDPTQQSDGWNFDDNPYQGGIADGIAWWDGSSTNI
jgi:hypothetical protein